MATAGADTGAKAAPKNDGPKAQLAEDFQPNEPTAKSGTNEKGEPDGTLGDTQVERAATEALLSLRPQPSVEQVHKVLEVLAEVDPKTKQPVKKFKSASDAGKAAVDELNKLG